jgi:hypothetical protein
MANITWKKENYNYNVTIVNFMLNNNRQILTENIAQNFKIEMDILFCEKMSDYSKYLFGNNKIISLVSIEIYDVKVGSKQKRSFLHIIFKIETKYLFTVIQIKKLHKIWLKTENNTKGWTYTLNLNKIQRNEL